jgi:hypothetical protein
VIEYNLYKKDAFAFSKGALVYQVYNWFSAVHFFSTTSSTSCCLWLFSIKFSTSVKMWLKELIDVLITVNITGLAL